jgi:hypothetical protein
LKETLQLETCKFSIKFFDLESRKFQDFKCKNNILDTDLCIFHDRDYLKVCDARAAEHNAKVDYAFKKKVDESLLDNNPLTCIGYRLHHVKLSNKEFKKPVYFINCKINRAGFNHSVFHDGAEFTGVEVSGESNFYDADFSHKAYFAEAKFFGDTRFTRAKFSNEARFTNAKFYSTTNFSEARFSELANFNEAQFFGDTRFTRAKFSNEARFTNAKFYSTTNFSEARFSDIAYFLTDFEGECLFNYVFFERPQNIFFNTNLSNVSFMNSDVSSVKFGEKVLWGGNGFKVADEIKLERLFENSSKLENKKLSLQGIESLEDIKAIYRNLRENYEYRMRYDEASNFFVREMELKRKFRESKSRSMTYKNSFFRERFSLTGVYYYLFGYGESLRKLAFTSIGLFGSFLALYWLFYISPLFNHHESFNPSEVIINSTTTVISDMFQIKGQDLQPLDYVIRITSLSVLGLLIIALKRKFERRLRH